MPLNFGIRLNAEPSKREYENIQGAAEPISAEQVVTVSLYFAENA